MNFFKQFLYFSRVSISDIKSNTLVNSLELLIDIANFSFTNSIASSKIW